MNGENVQTTCRKCKKKCDHNTECPEKNIFKGKRKEKQFNVIQEVRSVVACFAAALIDSVKGDATSTVAKTDCLESG